MTNKEYTYWENLKKQYTSNILEVYSLEGEGISIPPKIKCIVEDSARCYKSMDLTEGISFTHCISQIKGGNETCNSENDYQVLYNKRIGPLTSHKSIPDGSITVDDIIHLISVFRLSNFKKIIHGYLCRKVEKLLHVASAEYNEDTSLFYSKFPDKKIKHIKLHFYIWIPEVTPVNKIKNVIKQIHRIIFPFISEMISINYNIFQTFGQQMEDSCWKSEGGMCIYHNPRPWKMSKLKKIYDIKNVLTLFIKKDTVEYYLCDTFINDTFFNDPFFTDS
jgi:hypothetical protein